MLERIVSVTVVLIMAYLLLASADKLRIVTNAIASVYINSVKTLQGR